MESASRSKIAFETVRRRCPAEVQEWLDRTFYRLETPLDHNIFGAAYAGARRRLGGSTVALNTGEEATLQGAGLRAVNGRTLDEVYRLALLMRAFECLPEEDHAPFINEVYLR